jgi:predicted nucleic-acid-binding protein
VKITADTNLLVRAMVEDEPRQAQLAQAELASAELIALPLPALCEVVWVLGRIYRRSSADIAVALRALISNPNVAVNRAAAEAGLALLDAGGDFADGVIAYEGRWLGAEEFVSFDQQAVGLMAARGEPARLLA